MNWVVVVAAAMGEVGSSGKGRVRQFGRSDVRQSGRSDGARVESWRSQVAASGVGERVVAGGERGGLAGEARRRVRRRGGVSGEANQQSR